MKMYGHGWRWFDYAPTVPGYSYIGPCRCGRGPHAYYLDRSGRFAHAHYVPWWGVSTPRLYKDNRAELDALHDEKEHIERRIQILEDDIKER